MSAPVGKTTLYVLVLLVIILGGVAAYFATHPKEKVVEEPKECPPPTDCSQYEQQLSQCQADKQSLQSQLNECLSDKASLQQQVSGLQSQLDECQSQVQQLQQQLQQQSECNVTELCAPKTLDDFAKEWLGSMLFAKSFHATTKGMGYWYTNGFYEHTGIPYEQLGCKHCHATCETCHLAEENGVQKFSVEKARDMNTCLQCHGREKKSIAMGLDLHFSNGMKCMDCHKVSELHGLDQAAHNFYREPGVLKTHCTDCHKEGGQAPVPSQSVMEHQIHVYQNNDLDCTACHVKTLVTCYSCHFDVMLEQHKKVAYPVTGWMFLAKDSRTGKFYSANIMALAYEGKDTGDVYIAIQFPHTVTKEGRHCVDCHNNPNVQMLKNSNTIKVTWWNETTGKLEHLSGVIPIVEGKTYEFQLVVVDHFENGSPVWKPLKVVAVVPDEKHLINGAQPLDQAAFSMLSTPMGG